MTNIQKKDRPAALNEQNVRSAAVAGFFYPDNATVLSHEIHTLLHEARRAEKPVAIPKAIIVPHAGYVYSAAIAATAFSLLTSIPSTIKRVVLMGPAHRLYVDGMASPGVAFMDTPLGRIAVDQQSLSQVPIVQENRAAHEKEHCLEVELPFLQIIAPDAMVVPILVGACPAHVVGSVLERLWGGSETLVVISSDLSHYLPYQQGRKKDQATAEQIVSLSEQSVDPEQACGAACINGLLWVARKKQMSAHLLDLLSSGDTGGRRDGVVGYGSFAFYEANVVRDNNSSHQC